MLDSVKIQRRQSEIRQALAGLVGKADPSADEVRQIETLDAEYRTDEVCYRGALVAEDAERREAGADLEGRAGREWADLVSGFSMREAALFLDEGRQPTGRTAEVVTEMRSRGGYRGVPSPMAVKPIVDRLFPDNVAGKMGVSVINIDAGNIEYPVVSSFVSAGWAASETRSVAGPTVFATTWKDMKPDSTLDITMKVTLKALKSSGDGPEAAIRRDMSSAVAVELDRATFLGTGADGQPLGISPGAVAYGITATAVSATASWAMFRAGVVRLMNASATTGPAGIKALLRPEVWDTLDQLQAGDGAPMWEWNRLVGAFCPANVTLSSNALAAPTGTPLASTAVLMTAAGGLPPAFVGLWGGVDLIRDPYSDATSGGLRLTGLLTADVTVARGSQVEILTGIQPVAAT